MLDRNNYVFFVFLSTPSGWRATMPTTPPPVAAEISIHALRVEGDSTRIMQIIKQIHFYPRPPGGGRRRSCYAGGGQKDISIHALRVEGDQAAKNCLSARRISIHALRVEGDKSRKGGVQLSGYFYPRPPGGGRRWQIVFSMIRMHFYPRPPGGGRRSNLRKRHPSFRFLSTPSGWRATYFK